MRMERLRRVQNEIDDLKNFLTIKDALMAKREREKLTKYTRMINHVLEYFEFIDPRNVPVRDRKSVSIYSGACFKSFNHMLSLQ